MSNIRVDVDYTIKDGTELKFRSPVDCSQITGLIVYYPGTDGNTVSMVFALSDAHGNNVGDIDHLFAEDVVVKVILDVTKGMAFVQNADTNAYLENKFDTKAGKLTWLYTYGSTGLGHGEKSITLETMHDYNWLMIVWKAHKDSQQYYRSFLPVNQNSSLPSNRNLRIETIMGGGYYRNVSITDTGISVTTATKADDSATATAYCTLIQVWGFQ